MAILILYTGLLIHKRDILFANVIRTISLIDKSLNSKKDYILSTLQSFKKAEKSSV